ncbi:VanZ family protein [Microbacterium sp. 179-B 1A2 NHS]|uniref:VanZ family protein n=1 Tax=Microbacterium sp. 179-B 1A2 NHS TaxID=3142383 RepID=UPI00399EEEFC
MEQVTLGVIAVVLGVAVGFVLFIPFVAISYRRRGRLSFGRIAMWAAFLVYFWAIWTYTLLPLPEPGTLQCVGTNLNPFEFIDDIRGAIARPGNTFTDFAILQLALNVLLFLPLGFFLRVLGGRGILTALLIGLGLSALVETTQLTGVWGLYPCAYRVFDVDDMLTNTLGAVIGSLAGLAVPAHHRGLSLGASTSAPAQVTRGRRVIAMLCDWLGATIVTASVGISVQFWLEYVVADHDAVLDGRIASFAGTWAPIMVWLVLVLATGRTVGDIAVDLRYRGGNMPVVIARLLRYGGGIGGYLLVGLLPVVSGLAMFLFCLTSIVLVFITAQGRGLPGILSDQEVTDARADAHTAI